MLRDDALQLTHEQVYDRSPWDMQVARPEILLLQDEPSTRTSTEEAQTTPTLEFATFLETCYDTRIKRADTRKRG